MIVANTTFRLAPWADALYAMDVGWWRTYGREVVMNFPGARFTCNPAVPKRCGAVVIQKQQMEHYGNSGAASMALAAHFGAARVVMLGYDCGKPEGKAHWHGDHPRHLGNANSIDKWLLAFPRLAADFARRGVEVINASRYSALDCFPRMELEHALRS